MCGPRREGACRLRLLRERRLKGSQELRVVTTEWLGVRPAVGKGRLRLR